MAKKAWAPTLKTKAIVLTNDLKEFLKKPINMTSREQLLTRRFLYDVGVAAAHGGYALQDFLPEVDRDGIDVVLSDADETKPIQMKATIVNATPSLEVGNVHCGALRPNLDVAEDIGFEPTQAGTGQHGCIVLIEAFNIDLAEIRIDARYWITDAYILAALSHAEGLVPGAPKTAQADASALIRMLHQGTNHDRISVRRSCFVPAANPSALLTLAGLHSHSPYNASHGWQYNLREVMRRHTKEENEQLGAVQPLTPEQVREKWTKAHEGKVREAFTQCLAWPKTTRRSKKASSKT